MKHIPREDLCILESDVISREICASLLEFYRKYQQKDLEYFLRLRLDWLDRHPDHDWPGIFAEVDSITGEEREPAKQFCWSWGDNRALGIWVYFLIKNRIAPGRVNIRLSSGKPVQVDLRQSYESYCRHIYESLLKRYEENKGHFPFMVDPATNKPANDPRNIPLMRGEFETGHVFAINAMFQYGIWQNDKAAIAAGRKILDECMKAGPAGRLVFHKNPKGIRGHGGTMVTLGAIVDVLKSIDLSVKSGRTTYATLRGELLSLGLQCIDHIIGKFTDRHTGVLREFNTPDNRPYVNDSGWLIGDPGHMAEAAGFIAEFCSFLGSSDMTPEGRSFTDILGFAMHTCMWVSEHGYSSQGLMYKNVDLRTLQGVPDSQLPDGRKCRTAPWWNVREHSAAAIRLFALTKHPECMKAYRKANNASYLNYPNANIGGLMVQTLDADTKEPLPLHPATGNLDPMHTGRSREREIEALEEIRRTLT